MHVTSVALQTSHPRHWCGAPVEKLRSKSGRNRTLSAVLALEGLVGLCAVSAQHVLVEVVLRAEPLLTCGAREQPDV